MTVKDSLRKWRIENKLTQREVAEKLGVAQQQYQLYETKRDISAKAIRKIAIEFNVSADVLLGLKD